METKQTAIEWLVEQVEDFIGLIPVDIIEQALAMEKEQIMDAHEKAYIDMNLSFRSADRAEEYYNETYMK
jgi:hypothetical protein